MTSLRGVIDKRNVVLFVTVFIQITGNNYCVKRTNVKRNIRATREPGYGYKSITKAFLHSHLHLGTVMGTV